MALAGIGDAARSDSSSTPAPPRSSERRGSAGASWRSARPSSGRSKRPGTMTRRAPRNRRRTRAHRSGSAAARGPRDPHRGPCARRKPLRTPARLRRRRAARPRAPRGRRAVLSCSRVRRFVAHRADARQPTQGPAATGRLSSSAGLEPRRGGRRRGQARRRGAVRSRVHPPGAGKPPGEVDDRRDSADRAIGFQKRQHLRRSPSIGRAGPSAGSSKTMAKIFQRRLKLAQAIYQ